MTDERHKTNTTTAAAAFIHGQSTDPPGKHGHGKEAECSAKDSLEGGQEHAGSDEPEGHGGPTSHAPPAGCSSRPDLSTLRNSLLMQANDVASTDMYASAETSNSCWGNLLSTAVPSSGESACLPLDHSQSGSHMALAELKGVRSGAAAGYAGLPQPQVETAPVSQLRPTQPAGRISFGRLEQRLSHAGTRVSDGDRNTGSTAQSTDDTLNSMGTGGLSEAAPEVSFCNASASLLSSGPLPGAELSMGAVERMLFDERSQSIAPQACVSDPSPAASRNTPPGGRLHLRLGPKLKAAAADESSPLPPLGAMIKLKNALDFDAASTVEAATAAKVCISAAEAEQLAEVTACNTAEEAEMPPEGAVEDGASKSMAAIAEAAALVKQAVEVVDVDVTDDRGRFRAAADGSMAQHAAAQQSQTQVTAEEESDAEAADDLAAALQSEEDSDNDVDGAWEAAWESAEKDAEREEWEGASSSAAATGCNPHLTAPGSKSSSPRKSPRKRSRSTDATPSPNPNRRGVHQQGTCDRASVRAAAVAAATTSSPAPLQPALLNKDGTSSDHANIGFDSLSDEDDDRPVAELFSAWRARSGAIQAGNQDEAPRELDRIGAVSHIGEEPSPAQMAHSPLSPITAPLDPDLEAEMKQRGRGHVLLGPSYLQ